MITINEELRHFYPCLEREKEDVNEIILHGTGGSESATGLIRWMLSEDGRHKEYAQSIALFHYIIDRKGEIIQLYDPWSSWMFHSSSRFHDKNTIGIEMCNPDKKNQAEYTKEQYIYVVELFKELYEIQPIEKISGHTVTAIKYSGKPNATPCPGNFDWKRLCDMLAKESFIFDFEDQRIFNIKKS